MKRFRKLCMLLMVCMLAANLSLMSSAQVSAKSKTIASLQFESGGSTHTHQYIVRTALKILKNDKGSSTLNNSTNSSSLLSYTDWPDVLGNETDYGTYAGHFYDPDTGKNWLGQTSPTAMTRATSYFTKAVNAYNDGDTTVAIKYLGIGSHYVSDMNEPHHASNLTALNSNHSAFESYVDDNLSEFTISGNTFSSSVYTTAKNQSTTTFLKNGAKYAKSLATKAQDEDTYYEAADACVQHAIMNVTQYFYKFCVETGIY